MNSKNNIPIRMSDERWFHIIENHDDMAGFYDEILDTLEYPDLIIQGYNDAKIALRLMRQKKYLAVVYKEISETDGFIITAYFTTKLKLENEVIIWQEH